MARPASIIRPVLLNLGLPEDLKARMDLYLFSDLEGRIPRGAYRVFISERIREFFDYAALDTGFGVIRGPKETISRLQAILEASNGT